MKSTTDAKDVSILAALADPIRLAIVKRLSNVQEITGVELAKRLGISRALLCHHAGILVERRGDDKAQSRTDRVLTSERDTSATMH